MVARVVEKAAEVEEHSAPAPEELPEGTVVAEHSLYSAGRSSYSREKKSESAASSSFAFPAAPLFLDRDVNLVDCLRRDWTRRASLSLLPGTPLLGTSRLPSRWLSPSSTTLCPLRLLLRRCEFPSNLAPRSGRHKFAWLWRCSLEWLLRRHPDKLPLRHPFNERRIRACYNHTPLWPSWDNLRHRSRP